MYFQAFYYKKRNLNDNNSNIIYSTYSKGKV